MLESSHLVISNFLLCLVLISGLGFYSFVFPKRKVPWLIVVILFSILPIISIFRNGTYESGDLSVNAVKTMEFYHSLQEGQLIPRWAGNLNALYGYPLFIYTYPLPYYLASLFHFLGFGFIDSIKCLLVVSFISSGVSLYLFLCDFLDKRDAFVGSIFYLFAPYHLIDMHFRVDIGETLSFVFLPLIFWGIRKQLLITKVHWQLLTVLAVAGLLLSHQAVSLYFLFLAFLYLLFCYFNQVKKSRQRLLFTLLSMVWGGLLASFYIIPVLLESGITMQSHVASVYFFPLWNYLFSPYRYGLLFQGHHGELVFLIGYMQLLIIGYCIYLYLAKRVEKKLFFPFSFSFISLVCLFILMQWFTASLWYIVPFIKNFQFSYRLMVGIVFFTAVLAGISSRYIRRQKIVFFLCVFAIFSTILNWGNRRVIPEITDSVLMRTLPESSYRAEGLFPALPMWVDRIHPWMTKRPTSPIFILSGKAVVKQVIRKSTLHSYVIYAQNIVFLQENTLYYPGWRVFVDGNNIPISYRTRGDPGIIRFEVGKGRHFVRVAFTETIDRFAGEVISVLALGLFTGWIVRRSFVARG